MIRIGLAATDTPALPARTWKTKSQALAGAGLVHLMALSVLAAALAHATTLPAAVTRNEPSAPTVVDIQRLIFLPRDPLPGGGGGGGGGNRQSAPIRHAEAPGDDAYTLRVATPTPAPIAVEATPTEDSLVWPAEPPTVLLDALPLASGTQDHIGLPFGGVTTGTSTGPGSGGGVGEGAGTGIGSGTGPGIGPGSGGGTGGGAYRPGRSVSSPRVLYSVKPAYTSEALRLRCEGSVLLEVVVTKEGRAANIRIIRSLDPGLDEQAVIAAAQWRFAPGRLGLTAVDVLVTIQVDFAIR